MSQNKTVYYHSKYNNSADRKYIQKKILKNKWSFLKLFKNKMFMWNTYLVLNSFLNLR